MAKKDRTAPDDTDQALDDEEARSDDNAAASDDSIDPTNRAPQPPVAAESLPSADDDVLMVFPRDVRLMHDDGRVIQFKKGVQRVRADLADHWYLRAHNVQRA